MLKFIKNLFEKKEIPPTKINLKKASLIITYKDIYDQVIKYECVMEGYYMGIFGGSDFVSAEMAVANWLLDVNECGFVKISENKFFPKERMLLVEVSFEDYFVDV